ncbi:MAG: hypothetical protein OXD45_12850 [Rhodobacteraceae bacterium]|nr:hypothetical protein [Paracoccaceae bacterium]
MASGAGGLPDQPRRGYGRLRRHWRGGRERHGQKGGDQIKSGGGVSVFVFIACSFHDSMLDFGLISESLGLIAHNYKGFSEVVNIHFSWYGVNLAVVDLNA